MEIGNKFLFLATQVFMLIRAAEGKAEVILLSGGGRGDKEEPDRQRRLIAFSCRAALMYIVKANKPGWTVLSTVV